MVKKITQIIIKILIVLLILMMANIPDSRVEGGYWDETLGTGNNFIQKGKGEAVKNEAIDTSGFQKETNKVDNTLLALGIVLSVIIGGILGIQIMWGSIEQQVKAKEMLMPYALGCVVIFGAFGIWKLCVTVFSPL